VIIGTAGHIDHGKTSLVRTLTGIETDRLAEEKRRGITIDLGFAYVPLAGGATLGFVDVPGHERLVHTMIAGAASIDFCLLVVAADDGVMPQTREHVQVLDLLGLRHGLVAITKADLVDAARLAEVQRQVAALLAPTLLAGAECLAVSSTTGAGIPALRETLEAAALAHQPRSTPGLPRFAVDRSFSLAGAGTIVTGSLLAGMLRIGDAVLLQPRGLPARIRGLRAENTAVEQAGPGQRCALNLAGVAKDEIGRGDWVVAPALSALTTRLDVELRLLPSERAALRSWAPVLLHHGAAQVTARVVLLSGETLAPGETGLAQLVLEAPRPFWRGDRLVLRDVSAQRTLAGGRVLDPRAPERRRRTPARLAMLHALAQPEPLPAMLALPPYLLPAAALAQDWGLAEVAGPRIGDFLLAPAALAMLRAQAEAALAAHHAKQPAAPGLAPETLRLALPARLPRDAFAALAETLVQQGALARDAHWLRLPTHEPGLGGEDARLWARLEAALAESPFRPAVLNDLARALRLDPPLLRRAAKRFAAAGRLLEVAPDLFFLRAAVPEMARRAQQLSLATQGGFSAAQFRDACGNGRTQAILVLEYFDRRGLTLRRGDLRRVVKDPAALFGSSDNAR
jgi:selenocysteine-specific elongation factor